MKDFITRKLEINIKLRAVTKIGNKICLIETENTADKIKILKNRNKLKDIKEHKIYIGPDMSKKERAIQYEIRKVAKEERK